MTTCWHPVGPEVYKVPAGSRVPLHKWLRRKAGTSQGPFDKKGFALLFCVWKHLRASVVLLQRITQHKHSLNPVPETPPPVK